MLRQPRQVEDATGPGGPCNRPTSGDHRAPRSAAGREPGAASRPWPDPALCGGRAVQL